MMLFVRPVWPSKVRKRELNDALLEVANEQALRGLEALGGVSISIDYGRLQAHRSQRCRQDDVFLLTGFYRADSGEFRLAGARLDGKPRTRRYRRNRAHQNVRLFDNMTAPRM